MSGPEDNDRSFERVLASFLREGSGPSRRDCPYPGVLSTYFEGKLAEPEARELEVHLSRCSGCQAELAALVRLQTEAAGDTEGAEAVPPVASALSGPSPEPEAIAPPVEPDVEAIRSWRTRRRALRTWLGAVALAASAVLAISVTYRFASLIEQASRRSRDSGPSTGAPQDARQRESTAEEARQAPRAAFPAPTTEATPAMPGAESGAASFESSPRQEAEAIPSAPAGVEPHTNPTPAAAAPPAALAPGGEPSAMPAGRVEQLSQPRLADRAVRRPAQPANEERDAESAKAAQARVVAARTDPAVAWRVGDDSIERSDDGGKTWRAQAAGGATGLLAGSAPSARVCWLAGRKGLVLRTTDGEHWERLAPPTTGDLTAISALDATHATVQTSSDERFSTIDGGRIWSKP